MDTYGKPASIYVKSDIKCLCGSGEFLNFWQPENSEYYYRSYRCSKCPTNPTIQQTARIEILMDEAALSRARGGLGVVPV